MRHKLMGVSPCTFQCNLQPRNTTSRKTLLPSTQIWEWRNTASFRALPTTAALNPLLKVTKYLPNLQFSKWHLLSKKILGWKIDKKFKRGQPSKKTISRVILYSQLFLFFKTENKTAEKNDEFYEVSKTRKPKLQKPISSQQPEGPLA